MTRVLVVDDDPTFCLMLKTFLTRNGYEVQEAFNVDAAIKATQEMPFDVVLTDYRLPNKTGLDLLREIKNQNPNCAVILMTQYADIRISVQAIKLGAFDYVAKPVTPDEILSVIKNALDHLSASVRSVLPRTKFEYIKGESRKAERLQQYIKLVAPTPMSVIIEGESGTGKEYVARTIHQLSERNRRPFVAIDCGALSNELAGSELFGHVKGSFTGAMIDKTGQFQLANGGTLFLDEIGNLSYEIQLKLLRATQEGKIRKIGGNRDFSVDVRIIAATNENLLNAVKRGAFREDLYHRLNEFKIIVPPLRERDRDIDIFSKYFLKLANSQLKRNVLGFEQVVLDKFYDYSWPGNIREMKNVIKRSVLLTLGEWVTLDSLPPEIAQIAGFETTPEEKEKKPASQPPSAIETSSSDLKAFAETNERAIIMDTLIKVRYNKTKAAKLLNIDRKTLYNKMKLYNIEG